MAAHADDLTVRYRPVLQAVWFTIYVGWVVVAFFVPDWAIKLLCLGVQTTGYVMILKEFISQKPILGGYGLQKQGDLLGSFVVRDTANRDPNRGCDIY